MDDLTAFVSARLDEDEAAAKDAESACWHIDYCDELGAPFHARHDPTRALREVAAKRAILAENDTKGWQAGDRVHDCQWQAWPCRTLRLLAAVWSDHPDYQQEWIM